MRTRTDALVFWAGGGVMVAGYVASWLAAPHWLSLSAIAAGALLVCAAALWRVAARTRTDESERRFLVPLAGLWAGVALVGLALRASGRGYDVGSLCLMAAGGGAGAFFARNYVRRT